MESETLDLRGVACPLSWAKAKVRLELLPKHGEIVILLDEPKGARDLPIAAEAEGYAVIATEHDGQVWRITVQK